MNLRSPGPSADGAALDAQSRLPKSDDTDGEILAAHGLAPDCLVILGWRRGEMVAEGLASLGAVGSDQGRFRAVSWSIAGSQERWYVAAVRVSGISDMRPGEALLLYGSGANGAIAVHVPARTEGAAFADALRKRAGLNHAMKFLLETFSSRASRQLGTVSAFLAAILDSASQEGGMVEIIGAIEGEGLLLQGWFRQALTGRQRLLLFGDILDEHEAVCANFSRPDLDGRGLGMLALVRSTNASIDHLRSVYVRARDQFYRLSVVPNAKRLSDDEAPYHLRAMLPTLLADEGLQQSLRLVARPRFAGVDTVSSLAQPLRMAIDLAAHIPGVGWYLTGWMLDPANLVAKVILRDREGMMERIDLRWTRVRREDVCAGFRGDPLFQGLIASDLHGFTVFVQHSAASIHAWLELQLKDENSAFMPLHAVSAEGGEGRRRLLESFDLHKPSALEIIERHLGPLFHAAKAAPWRRPGHQVLHPWGGGRDRPEAVVIIPLVDTGIRAKLVVAELARRNPGRGVAPVFVCSPTLGDEIDALSRAVAFYGLDAEILRADAAIDTCEALDIGACASAATRLVFIAPSTHPLRANWAADLLAVAERDEPVVVTPTLLYEDWSICYAGIDGIRFLDAAPFADPAHARAGYPRDAVPAAGVTATLAGSLDCCALTRSAYERLDGFSGGYALARTNGLDLFLRMRKAGVPIRWMPQVEAYTLGDSNSPGDYWLRAGEIVDGWSLRASWKDRLPPIVDLQHDAHDIAATSMQGSPSRTAVKVA